MTADRRVASVRPLPSEGPYVVEAQWMDGRVARADLASQLLEFKLYEPIRDPAVFAQVRIGDDGWVLEWPGGVEIPSDAVARLADEYAADTAMLPEQFREWRLQENLTLEQAARAWLVAPGDRLLRERRRQDSARRCAGNPGAQRSTRVAAPMELGALVSPYTVGETRI